MNASRHHATMEVPAWIKLTASSVAVRQASMTTSVLRLSTSVTVRLVSMAAPALTASTGQLL